MGRHSFKYWRACTIDQRTSHQLWKHWMASTYLYNIDYSIFEVIMVHDIRPCYQRCSVPDRFSFIYYFSHLCYKHHIWTKSKSYEHYSQTAHCIFSVDAFCVATWHKKYPTLMSLALYNNSYAITTILLYFFFYERWKSWTRLLLLHREILLIMV
jgi:hypothetical protein